MERSRAGVWQLAVGGGRGDIRWGRESKGKGKGEGRAGDGQKPGMMMNFS